MDETALTPSPHSNPWRLIAHPHPLTADVKVRALLESQKNIMNELVADGFFEESDVEAMNNKISVYMFQLDRMRHSAGAAWGLLKNDLHVPVLSEHKKIQELRGLLSKVSGWAGGWVGCGWAGANPTHDTAPKVVVHTPTDPNSNPASRPGQSQDQGASE